MNQVGKHTTRIVIAGGGVMVDWTLDLLLRRRIEQMVRWRGAEAVADRLARIHARTTQINRLMAAPLRDDTLQSIGSS
jgi:hypothetical protein